jgi:hypothetical protein
MNDKTRDIFRQAITKIFDQYPEDDKEINKMFVPDPFVTIFTKLIIEEALLVNRNAVTEGVYDINSLEKIVKKHFGIV